MMKNNAFFKIIGTYQFLSGLGGIVLTVLSLDFQNNIKLTFGFFTLSLFSLVLYAGIMLYRTTKAGIKFSIFIQFLQIFNFNIFGLKYIFCSGSKLTILFPSVDIDYALIMEQVILALNSNSENFISVNLVALILFVGLLNNFRIKKNLM